MSKTMQEKAEEIEEVLGYNIASMFELRWDLALFKAYITCLVFNGSIMFNRETTEIISDIAEKAKSLGYTNVIEDVVKAYKEKGDE